MEWYGSLCTVPANGLDTLSHSRVQEGVFEHLTGTTVFFDRGIKNMSSFGYSNNTFEQDIFIAGFRLSGKLLIIIIKT